MTKPKFAYALVVVCMVSLCSAFSSQAKSMSEDEYAFLEKNINSDYRVAKNKCLLLAVNVQAQCVAVVKDKKNTSKLELDKNYRSKVSARNDSFGNKPETDYSVALQKCEGKYVEDKELCKKIAKNILDNEIENTHKRKGQNLPRPDLLTGDQIDKSDSVKSGTGLSGDSKKTRAM
jgi:hypothetical protein